MNNKTEKLKRGQTYSHLRAKTLILTGISVVLALGVSSLTLYTRPASTQDLDRNMPTLKGDAAAEYLKRKSDHSSLADAFKSVVADDLRDNPEAMVKLIPNDGVAGGRFGSSVAIDGNTAIIGATKLPQGNGGTSPGAAYIFIRSGASWTFQQKLTAPDAPANNGNAFGDTVGISGDTVVVAAPQHTVFDSYEGGVYVYVRTGTTWSLQKRFTNADTPLVAGGKIGFSVAISGDTVLVTAFGFMQFSPHRHFVDVFVREGTTWTIQATLITGGDDAFDSRVAISGNTAVIGNPSSAGTRQEAAYIYVRCGTEWTQQQRLTQSDGSGFDDFGGSVAISGNTVIVGAKEDQTGANQRGSAYIYATNGTTWTEQAKLTGAVQRFGFGQSVTIFGDTAVVGAPAGTFQGGTQAGGAEVFVRSGTTWTRDTTITAPDGQPGDAFGSGVAISSDVIMVGAPYDDFGSNNKTNEGSAWAIDRITAEPPPYNPCETQIEVNITTDQPDADLDDDICDVDTGTSGEQCSLRAAIETANAKAGPDEISFNIEGAGPHTISPATMLPAITEKVLLDATTQPGYSASPLIELSGNGGFAGLTFDPGSGDSSVSGLAINRFLTGISLQTSGIKIERSYIGLGPDGSPAGMRSVQQAGIEIKTAAAMNNTVGGPANLRNVISNNTVGVAISLGATANKVLGNRIGTSSAGTAAIPNETGVVINGANNNQIGDGIAANSNVISGNAGNGVECVQTFGTMIKGNTIGVTAAGEPLGNGGHGIFALDSPDITIGGEEAEDGNTIGSNSGNGILIETSPDMVGRMQPRLGGSIIRGNLLGVVRQAGNFQRRGNAQNGILVRQVSGLLVGGTAPGAANAIGANSLAGIVIDGPDSNLNELFGNFIGTAKNASGLLLQGLGNGGDGVRVKGACLGNKIGDSVAGAGNTIVSNGGNGILVEPSTEKSTRRQPNLGGSFLKGNLLGLVLQGQNLQRMGNNQNGMLIKDCAGLLIGGTEAGAGNSIGANTLSGLMIDGPNTSLNELFGNLIGTLKNAQGVLLEGGGNGGDGVRLVGAGAGNKIGDSVAGAGNTIVSNGGNGILVEPSEDQLANRQPDLGGNFIKGNFVGLLLQGSNLQRRGNTQNGILIKQVSGLLVGGTEAGAGNSIGANSLSGMVIDGADSNLNELFGNFIGTAKNALGQLAEGLGNDGDGVRLRGACLGNKIGDSVAGAGNTIVSNGGNGILVEPSTEKSTRRQPNLGGSFLKGNLLGLVLQGQNLQRMGNNQNGMLVKDCAGLLIGGTEAGAGNSIGANTLSGMMLDGPGANLSELFGNFIGTGKNALGQLVEGLGNGGDGVHLIGDGAGSKIGDSVAGAGNTIVSNGGNGILVEPSEDKLANRQPNLGGLSISGNLVGLVLQGSNLQRRGNSQNGILVRSSGVMVGGTGASAGNSIGANGLSGVELAGAGAELNEMVGNLVGAIRNVQGLILTGGGNGGDGVRIFGAPRNRIGSSTAAQANIIIDNVANGILINGSTAVDNEVLKNLIGVESLPPPDLRNGGGIFGNGSHGILLENGAQRTTLGGTTAAAGLVIANNGGNGIRLASTAGSGNRFGANSIFGNTLPGIDLGGNGFTVNDPADPDVGPNNLQNYPTFSLSIVGGNLILNYQVDSAPANSVYGATGIKVDFYEADSTGQGSTLLGTDQYLASDYANGTPGTRQKNLGNAAALGIVAGDKVTATATDADGNSSEFTPAVIVPGGAPGFEGDVAPRPNGDGNLLSTDVTQLRRFVAGLDTPNPATNEVQRIDCAPRSTGGDGIINSTDVVQGRRFVAGLDPLTPAGGPARWSFISKTFTDDLSSFLFTREIRIGQSSVQTGRKVSVPVEMISNGNETAMSFTIEYDATILSNPRVNVGKFAPPGSTLTVNTNEPGRIGILIDSTGSMAASAMPQTVLTVTFDVIAKNESLSFVRLSGSLAAMGISDSSGNLLATKYLDGKVILYSK